VKGEERGKGGGDVLNNNYLDSVSNYLSLAHVSRVLRRHSSRAPGRK
jgi:hypothetical protein